MPAWTRSARRTAGAQLAWRRGQLVEGLAPVVVVVTRAWQRVPGVQDYRPETDTVARAGSFCIGLDWEGPLGSATFRNIDGTDSQEATANQGALRSSVEDIGEYAPVVPE